MVSEVGDLVAVSGHVRLHCKVIHHYGGAGHKSEIVQPLIA